MQDRQLFVFTKTSLMKKRVFTTKKTGSLNREPELTCTTVTAYVEPALMEAKGL